MTEKPENRNQRSHVNHGISVMGNRIPVCGIIPYNRCYKEEHPMQYMIRALDGENMLEKRLEVRQAHLDNLSSIKGKILCAGGLLDEEGKMKGSALVIDFDSPEALQEYLDSEPYIKTGVWQDVETHRMNVVIFDGAKVK